MAIAAPCAVHLGTDSMAFWLKAQVLHEMLRKGVSPKRPLITQRDGDLWQVYFDSVRAKGVQSVQVTKVKAWTMWSLAR